MLLSCVGKEQKHFVFQSMFFLFVLLWQIKVLANVDLPKLQDQGHSTQLIISGKPFLMLGGELGNSSASDMAYMQDIWPKLKAMNLNTVLVPVYWELLEPAEGQYDFSLVKVLIDRARKEDLKLVLLWFGSWKNSMSSYAPGWVKRDQTRFPRAMDDNGVGQEILTPFNLNNLEADIKIFSELMGFLKRYDSKKNTVIMVQVENEIGMLPTARDHHPEANTKYNAAVPDELMTFLTASKEHLAPELKSIWEKQGLLNKGNWEQVFGKGIQTEEIFMAWYFAVYANAVAAAGKNSYALPMFVNAALNRPGKRAGEYPSAGPLPHVMDIWKAASPAIDMYVPDFYNPRFKHWNDLYTRNGAPLLIPEIRFDDDVATKALYAFGHYNCIGFSPFSIESTDEPEKKPLGKIYQLLEQIKPLLVKYQGTDNIDAVMLTKDKPKKVLKFGNYVITAKHDYTLGWSPNAKDDSWPETAAIVIQTGKDEFYFVGTGVVFTFDVPGKMRAGLEEIFEGKFVNGVFKKGRSLNGDQSHQGRHLRIEMGKYDIQRLKLYQYQ